MSSAPLERETWTDGHTQVISAREALDRLREGNRRFVSGNRIAEKIPIEARRRELVEGQHPFAVVLGCSDSRVPVEMVFDQGPGDLFVVRIAGNVVTPSQLGTVEFAVEQLGSPLVVVLGHTRCGAVEATLAYVTGRLQRPSPHVQSVIDHIRPEVLSEMKKEGSDDPAQLIDRIARANVRAAATRLVDGSQLLERLAGANEIHIVGAEYSLETGSVDFFHGVPLAE